MSSTETCTAAAAVTALTPRWPGGGEDDVTVAPADDGDDDTDWQHGHRAADWATGALRSAWRDPYGQHFRPHLFGI